VAPQPNSADCPPISYNRRQKKPRYPPKWGGRRVFCLPAEAEETARPAGSAMARAGNWRAPELDNLGRGLRRGAVAGGVLCRRQRRRQSGPLTTAAVPRRLRRLDAALADGLPRAPGEPQPGSLQRAGESVRIDGAILFEPMRAGSGKRANRPPRAAAKYRRLVARHTSAWGWGSREASPRPRASQSRGRNWRTDAFDGAGGVAVSAYSFTSCGSADGRRLLHLRWSLVNALATAALLGGHC
jgi:hypothetical protein